VSKSEITGRREWGGGVEGEELTLHLHPNDRLRLVCLERAAMAGGAVIWIQDDGQGRVEVSIENGSVTLYS
jgi:hypothetical protein